MFDNLQEKLLKKDMTRRDFLQFVGSSVLLLFGLGNIISFILHMKKSSEPVSAVSSKEPTSHGFGSRKFGV
jgi:hypothetical protein